MKSLLTLLNLWNSLDPKTRDSIENSGYLPYLVIVAILAFALSGGYCYHCLTCPTPHPHDQHDQQPEPDELHQDPLLTRLIYRPDRQECPAKKNCACGCVDGEPCRCLTSPGVRRVDYRLNGVEGDKISKTPRYTLNGRLITSEQAYEAVGNTLADDTNKLRVTLLGAEAECTKVKQDLEANPLFAPHKDFLLVNAYRPDHPVIANLGFAPGNPSIYLQRVDGKVLHRQADYSGGPERLLKAVNVARRQMDPNYKPDKDPDLTKPSDPLSSLANLPPWVYVAGVIAFLLLTNKKS